MEYLDYKRNQGKTEHSPEAESEVFLVSAAVREPRAGRLGFANTTAFVAAVNLGFMEAEHLVGL